jgi:hypothetical protein
VHHVLTLKYTKKPWDPKHILYVLLLLFKYRIFEFMMGKLSCGQKGRLYLDKFPCNSKILWHFYLHNLKYCCEHRFCGLAANYFPLFISALSCTQEISLPFMPSSSKLQRPWGEREFCIFGETQIVCYALDFRLLSGEMWWEDIGNHGIQTMDFNNGIRK